MKNFTLLLKTTLIAVFAIYASMNLSAGTITIVPDQATTGSTSASYVTTLFNFSAQGIDWAINAWNPSSLQTRGTATAPQFQFYNTTEIPGSITSVTINTKSNTTIDSGTNYLKSASVFLAVGTTVQDGTSTTGLTASTPGTNSVSWDVTGDNNYFRIQYASGATSGNVYISNIVIEYSESTNPAAATPTFSVPTGVYTDPQSVTIATATDGASIYYTTDGSDPTASSTLYTTPVTVSTTTTIKAIAVKEGIDNSYIATATYTFPVEVANIAEFNALPSNTIGKITGAITVAYQNGSNMFVQDASSWLLIYGSTTKTYQSGDQLTGVIGTFMMYGTPAYPELAPVTGIELPDGVAGAPATPAAIAPADITNADMNRYVALNNVEIAADVTFTGATGVSGTIVNGDGTMIIRDYWGLINNTYTQGAAINVTGFVRYASSALMIYVLSVDPYTGINTPQFSTANVYAENGVICINNIQETAKITVYDLSGKLVFQTTAANTAKISVAKGVYVVKVGTQAFKVVNK